MTLDKSDIDKIAWLARFSISQEDIPNYLHDVSNILKLVEKMNSVNTDDIEPLAHPLDQRRQPAGGRPRRRPAGGQALQRQPAGGRPLPCQPAGGRPLARQPAQGGTERGKP